MYYKDLEVYKKSIELVIEIYNIASQFPKDEQFGLVSQIKRAVISIPSNIAEGSARYSNKDSARFVDIAIGSIAEVDTQLSIAKRLGFVDNIEETYEHIKQVNALLLGFKKYLNQNQDKVSEWCKELIKLILPIKLILLVKINRNELHHLFA